MGSISKGSIIYSNCFYLLETKFKTKTIFCRYWQGREGEKVWLKISLIQDLFCCLPCSLAARPQLDIEKLVIGIYFPKQLF